MSVRESTGLTTINQYLRRQRLSIFSHIARLDPAVPANAALRLAVDTKEGRRPDRSWSRRPGRPRHTWADQVCEDAGIPLSTLWSAEVAKGHRAARRSSTRRQWWSITWDVYAGTRRWSSKHVIASTGWDRNATSSYTGCCCTTCILPVRCYLCTFLKCIDN